VATFKLPWRLAFLPDGRMLVTEKVGPVWLVTQQGEKIQVENTPAVYFSGQSGMHGVFLSPHYATDHSIYLTYAAPGEYGGGLAMARAKLNVTATSAKLENFEVLWRQMPTGKGGQEGAQIAFAPDGNSLFLAVGDRQRMTPAQDPDEPVGKILHLEDTALLRGIDGITFCDATLYVNSVSMNKVYRIPVDAAGKAGQPVEISLDQPVKGPDGMRAAKGKLLLAENGSGKISVITVTGDKATVTVIKEGLKTPTAVERFDRRLGWPPAKNSTRISNRSLIPV
jgi:hypothetical protein